MYEDRVSDVTLTHARPPITRLDDMPFVDRSLINYEKYNKYIGQSMVKDCLSVQASRGCPYRCAYCHKVWGKKHFVRSAENLFEEVKLFYNMGVKRFAFVDDIFNFDVKNSTKFFQMIIKNKLNVQLFYPNGLRGDILTEDYIDLMVEAGTVNIAFALETGSPRLQKLIKKHLNIDKFRKSIEYTCAKYPEIIVELQTMHGFPTESEEEAMMTLDFIFDIRWLDFPYVNVLKIFPNTDMEKIALENGISREAIAKSRDLTYDELPLTLPFDKNFSHKYQTKFLHRYFLSKERLLAVLPYQMKLFDEDELMQKYRSYMPGKFDVLANLLEVAGISKEELGVNECIPGNSYAVPDLNNKIRERFPGNRPADDALRILLLDVTLFFSGGREVLYNVVEPPIGLMYLLTHLENEKGDRVNGKVAKSRMDYDSFAQLKEMVDEFQPHVIGMRSLSLYKDFFHETAANIRQWGFIGPIIAGGPYGTSDYSMILKDANVDLVVLGEGELTFCELITAIIENDGKLPGDHVLKEIAGIAFAPGREAREQSVPSLSHEEIEARRKEKLVQFNDDLEDE